MRIRRKPGSLIVFLGALGSVLAASGGMVSKSLGISPLYFIAMAGMAEAVAVVLLIRSKNGANCAI